MRSQCARSYSAIFKCVWFICDKITSVLSSLFQCAAKQAVEEEEKAVKKEVVNVKRLDHKEFWTYTHISRYDEFRRDKQNTSHSFSCVDVNLGEKQLVAVIVLSRPVNHHFFNVGQVADETWQQQQNQRTGSEGGRSLEKMNLFPFSCVH